MRILQIVAITLGVLGIAGFSLAGCDKVQSQNTLESIKQKNE